MMRLYFTPGACSLVPHILLREMKMDVQLERVKLKNKTVASSGNDYLAINPKGAVPALEIREGEVLTEVVAMIQYLADLKPELGLVPAWGTMERYRCLEWLNYLATEIHKGFTPLFVRPPLVSDEQAHDELSDRIRKNLGRNFDYLSSYLRNHEYLMKSAYGLADIYLFVLLGWAQYVKLDLGNWPELVSYRERISKRPAVQEAMGAEGLMS